jgi:urease accessory protein UreH
VYPGPAAPPPSRSTANDYNVTFSKVLETGGVMGGDRISIQLEILAILQQD